MLESQRREALLRNDLDLMEEVAAELRQQGETEEADLWSDWARRARQRPYPQLVVTPREWLGFIRHLAQNHGCDLAAAEHVHLAADELERAMQTGAPIVAPFRRAQEAGQRLLGSLPQGNFRLPRAPRAGPAGPYPYWN